MPSTKQLIGDVESTLDELQSALRNAVAYASGDPATAASYAQKAKRLAGEADSQLNRLRRHLKQLGTEDL